MWNVKIIRATRATSKSCSKYLKNVTAGSTTSGNCGKQPHWALRKTATLGTAENSHTGNCGKQPHWALRKTATLGTAENSHTGHCGKHKVKVQSVYSGKQQLQVPYIVTTEEV
jgi:predicted secreted protein